MKKIFAAALLAISCTSALAQPLPPQPWSKEQMEKFTPKQWEQVRLQLERTVAENRARELHNQKMELMREQALLLQQQRMQLELSRLQSFQTPNIQFAPVPNLQLAPVFENNQTQILQEMLEIQRRSQPCGIIGISGINCR